MAPSGTSIRINAFAMLPGPGLLPMLQRRYTLGDLETIEK